MKNKITAGYYGAFIALGLIVASLGPTLPALAAQTNSDLSAISILFTARAFGFLLGSLLMGRLYDRLPGHRLMALSILLLAVMVAAIPTVPLLWVLILLLWVIGLFEPGIDVGSNTMIVWLHQDKVSPFMNGLHFFFGVGAFLSPIIIAGMVAMTGTTQWAYWALAALIFLPALYIVRLPSPQMPPREVTKGGGKINWTLVVLIAVFFFLYGGAEISFGGWIFTYAVAQQIMGEETAALLTSAFWGALTLGRLLAIPVATRWRNRTIVFVGMFGSLFSVALILLWPQVVTAVWVGTIGLGLSMSAVFPTTLSLAERHLHVTGKMTSYFFVGASLGSMTIPWLIGQRFDTVGPLVMMVIVFVCLLAATAVFGVLVWQVEHQAEGVLVRK